MQNLFKKILNLFKKNKPYEVQINQEDIDKELRLDELDMQASNWQTIDQEQLKSNATNEKK